MKITKTLLDLLNGEITSLSAESTDTYNKGTVFDIVFKKLSDPNFAVVFKSERSIDEFSDKTIEYIGIVDINKQKFIHMDSFNKISEEDTTLTEEPIVYEQARDLKEHFYDIEKQVNKNIETFYDMEIDNIKNSISQDEIEKFNEKIKDIYSRNRQIIRPYSSFNIPRTFEDYCKSYKDPKLAIEEYTEQYKKEFEPDIREYCALVRGIEEINKIAESDPMKQRKDKLLKVLLQTNCRVFKITVKMPNGTEKLIKKDKGYISKQLKEDLLDNNLFYGVPIEMIENVAHGIYTVFDSKKILPLEISEKEYARLCIEQEWYDGLPSSYYQNIEFCKQILEVDYRNTKFIPYEIFADLESLEKIACLEENKLRLTVLSYLPDKLLEDKEYVNKFIKSNIFKTLLSLAKAQDSGALGTLHRFLSDIDEDIFVEIFKDRDFIKDIIDTKHPSSLKFLLLATEKETLNSKEFLQMFKEQKLDTLEPHILEKIDSLEVLDTIFKKQALVQEFSSIYEHFESKELGFFEKNKEFVMYLISDQKEKCHELSYYIY